MTMATKLTLWYGVTIKFSGEQANLKAAIIMNDMADKADRVALVDLWDGSVYVRVLSLNKDERDAAYALLKEHTTPEVIEVAREDVVEVTR
jgi:hypothetical protein